MKQIILASLMLAACQKVPTPSAKITNMCFDETNGAYTVDALVNPAKGTLTGAYIHGGITIYQTPQLEPVNYKVQFLVYTGIPTCIGASGQIAIINNKDTLVYINEICQLCSPTLK